MCAPIKFAYLPVLLCIFGHPLPSLTDSWTCSAASRHTTAPISHTRSAPTLGKLLSWPWAHSWLATCSRLHAADWVRLLTSVISWRRFLVWWTISFQSTLVCLAISAAALIFFLSSFPCHESISSCAYLCCAEVRDAPSVVMCLFVMFRDTFLVMWTWVTSKWRHCCCNDSSCLVCVVWLTVGHGHWGAGGDRGRCRPWQRWSWSTCRLLSGFNGYTWSCSLWIWTSLWLRHFYTKYPRWLAGKLTECDMMLLWILSES